MSKIDKSESALIIEGLEKAYVKMAKMKKEKKTPLVVSVNGKITKLYGDEIPSSMTITLKKE